MKESVRNMFVKRLLCALCVIGALMQLLSCPASAKTLDEWLEGYDLGDTWFGEDFAYDITDEEACWELLMRPITVLDAGQTEKIFPLKTPGGEKVNTDKLGGSINGASAAVHVLGENEDGYTLIEGLDYYNRVIRGYVKTRLLKTVKPRTDYGIIIDKLTQTLYVFKDGKLWSSCLVSTGLPNNEQPYNESAAGEYLVCSRVGDFNSEGMICATALRYNGGDMIHQVPYTENADGSANFSRFEPLLGSKASHGCIRTQRVKSPEGLNAQWLWDHIKLNTKVIVWDDRGRALPYPGTEDPVYYNPNGGSCYHSDQNCSSVKSKYLPLTEITYSDLETSAFLSLSPCPSCRPSKRISDIAEENLERGAITREEYLSVLNPIEYPEDDLELYYNPNGGKYYHSTANCSSVKERFLPLTAFTYGELEDSKFKKLTPCPYCSPAKRVAEIDKENKALGFDVEALHAAKDNPPEDSEDVAEDSAEAAADINESVEDSADTDEAVEDSTTKIEINIID